MPRLARRVARGFPHHVMQRGNRCLRAFFSDEDLKLREWCGRCGVEVWPSSLMPNHAHLIAVPETADGLRRAIGEAQNAGRLHAEGHSLGRHKRP